MFVCFPNVFPGVRFDFPEKNEEKPGPGQILHVSYSKFRVYFMLMPACRSFV